MKNIKPYNSFGVEREIKELCSLYEVKDYHINDDMSIDVDGDVSLSKRLKELKRLPLNFHEVNGYFGCYDNKLTTLEGCPEKTTTFNCSNNKLTSLEYSPKKVSGYFWCGFNPITSLEGLEDAYIGGQLNVLSCSKLYSLKGFPKGVFEFYYNGTPIEPIYNKFIRSCEQDTIRKFNKLNVVYDDGVYWYIDYDQLGKFLRSVGREHLMMSVSELTDFLSTTEYRFEY
jgi:hypothetical protein